MRDVVKYTYANEDLESTALEALWYDVFGRRLYVEFPNGDIGGYTGVAPTVIIDMEEAPSLGSYFNRNVKNKFHGTSGDVDLQPFNDEVAKNVNPDWVPTLPVVDRQEAMFAEYAETTDEQNEGIYRISFVVEGTTEFKAPSGNILTALNLFVGSFNENNKDAKVRVRSIAEVE